MERAAGVIGLGIMGSAIARNLLDRNWSVVGFDRAPPPRERMAASGVQVVASAAQVAKMAPILLTSLPDGSSAKTVAFEIAASGVAPRIVAKTSTLAIEDKDAFATIPVYRVLQEGGRAEAANVD